MMFVDVRAGSTCLIVVALCRTDMPTPNDVHFGLVALSTLQGFVVVS